MNQNESGIDQIEADNDQNKTDEIIRKTVLSLLLSWLITSVVACLLALIPTSQDKSHIPTRELKERISDQISKVQIEGNHEGYKDSLNSIVTKLIDENYKIDDIHEEDKLDSNLDFVVENVYNEFSWKLFTLLFVLIFFYSNSITWRDYLPVSSETKESGIHAKLNYQVIADRLSRKLAILMVGIIVFSIAFIFIIFKFSSEVDSIIHNDDIEAYETWINSIEFHVGKNNPTFTKTEEYYKLIETNTELFWKVYFMRFIIVRSFIALIVGTLITFLIRLYRRLRDDRELIIQKEEALSAIHYIARGEWRFRYDSLGKLLYKGINQDGENVIINEDLFNDLDPNTKLRFNPLKLAILEDDDAKIETRELLNVIPIRELFRSSGDNATPNKELLLNFEDSAQQLNQIKSDLRGLITSLNKK